MAQGDDTTQYEIWLDKIRTGPHWMGGIEGGDHKNHSTGPAWISELHTAWTLWFSPLPPAHRCLTTVFTSELQFQSLYFCADDTLTEVDQLTSKSWNGNWWQMTTDLLIPLQICPSSNSFWESNTDTLKYAWNREKTRQSTLKQQHVCDRLLKHNLISSITLSSGVGSRKVNQSHRASL